MRQSRGRVLHRNRICVAEAGRAQRVQQAAAETVPAQHATAHRVAAWVRHADVTALPFGDASLDVVASLDVLEHVPDYATALREFARVLRPGGVLLLSVPYVPGNTGIETLARREADGSITHLQPPEYHGDPMGGGVLCWHRFGAGLLDALRAAGFRDADAVAVQDPAAGLPQPVWVLSARR